MERNTSTRQPVETGPVVIAAPSLQTAHRRIRERFGDTAVILNTRSVHRRHELGLGRDRSVEVTVQVQGASAAHSGETGSRFSGSASPAGIPDELLREIERIEDLVGVVSAEYARSTGDSRKLAGNPAAEPLLAAGASAAVVRRLLERFAAANGAPSGNVAELRTWLGTQLRASNCGWEGFYGCHAFLGDSGSGRTDLILAAAQRLQSLGRRTLVLSVLPGDSGLIRRLQASAADGGYDAAVITRGGQLAESEAHMSAYDAVLVEFPRLEHEAMAVGGALHSYLASNVGFHRHLVVALDRDLGDQPALAARARVWNCDWVAVTRLDCTQRTGKLLDLLESVPLAVSLLSRNPLHGGDLDVAASVALAELVSPDGASAAGKPGREVDW